jgi:hypothetical protein
MARVGVLAVEPPANVFAGTLALELGGGNGSIAAALNVRIRRLDEDGEPVLQLLVIDQFEELFTAHPEHWSHRSGLFEELREALERDEQLRVLFVLREEYLAQLEQYGPSLPGGLKVRFRLERLDRASALEAVTRPLAGTGRAFAPGVAESLVDDLLTLRVDIGSGDSIEVPGEFVEPVHLQVVCSRLWAELPPYATEIRAEDIQALADLDTVLARFYEDALAAAQSRAGVSEARLRRWVRDELITPGGTRSTVYRGRGESAGLPNAAVEALEDMRLIRAEQRAGALWYELTHDRLITPIRSSDGRFDARLRRRRTRGLIALLVAAVLVAAAFGVAFGLFIESSREGELRPADELALARRFAPVIRFDSHELSKPISRAAYLSMTQLKEQRGSLVSILSASPRIDTLPETLHEADKYCSAPACTVFLDVRGVEPNPPRRSENIYNTIENHLRRAGARPTVYYHAIRDRDTGEYAVQYWFLYVFNYRINEHESDWEQITVRLDKDRRPVDVYYSAYDGGSRREFAKAAQSEHVVVYPARGSHANYFAPGAHPVALRAEAVVRDISDNRGKRLRPSDYKLGRLDGPVFIGNYGSGNYVVLTRQADSLGDPRLRTAWIDPLSLFPKRISVPNVIGATYEEAATDFLSAGFAVARRDVHDEQPTGTVVSQEPSAGSLALEGSTVTLFVSSGPR